MRIQFTALYNLWSDHYKKFLSYMHICSFCVAAVTPNVNFCIMLLLFFQFFLSYVAQSITLRPEYRPRHIIQLSKKTFEIEWLGIENPLVIYISHSCLTLTLILLMTRRRVLCGMTVKLLPNAARTVDCNEIPLTDLWMLRLSIVMWSILDQNKIEYCSIIIHEKQLHFHT